MEGITLGSRHYDEPEFDLREWRLKARISRESTSSRRFSASYIRSFREETRSFRSNFTISSAASSPGYHLKDEIDPSTYSFTTALKGDVLLIDTPLFSARLSSFKSMSFSFEWGYHVLMIYAALQARPGCVWEFPSPEGFALNSKWSEAERYICNPLSGEVPLECLSSKTLSSRSFRNLIASRITMSAPLVYSKRMDVMASPTNERDQKAKSATQEKPEHKTRDMGIQSSTPPNQSSYCPSPTFTPSIRAGSFKLFVRHDHDAATFSPRLNANEELSSSSTVAKTDKEEEETGEEESIQVEQTKETSDDGEDPQTKSHQVCMFSSSSSSSKHSGGFGCFPCFSIPWCCCSGGGGVFNVITAIRQKTAAMRGARASTIDITSSNAAY
ncbi:hypothetical protein AKJ16_DCAP06168 [Drosera capensis]